MSFHHHRRLGKRLAVTIHLSPDEAADLKRMAARSGLSVKTYAHAVATRCEPVLRKRLDNVLDEIDRLECAVEAGDYDDHQDGGASMKEFLARLKMAARIHNLVAKQIGLAPLEDLENEDPCPR